MLTKIKLDKSRQQGILDKMQAELRVDVTYLGFAIISSVIATFALLIEDIPILIGAMLIAPFLTPPLIIGMSLIKGDLRLFRKGLIILFYGLAVGVIGATLIALITPIKEIGDEILVRSAPTLIQLLIAILAGGAAAFSFAHKKISAVLAGTFIALALVPPISIIGIGIAFWNWEIIGGALLLLAANLIGLTLAAVIIFFLLGFRPINRPENIHEVKIGIIWLALLFFIIALPLGYIMNGIIKQVNQENTAQIIITNNLENYTDTKVDKLILSQSGKKVAVSFNIHSSQQINTSHIQAIKDQLEENFKQEVEIDAKLVPTFKIDY